jgi:hypothetical protein
MALGRALRHEYESKQEEMPAHMRRLVTNSKLQESPRTMEAATD